MPRAVFEQVMLDGEYTTFSQNDLKEKLASHGIVEDVRSRAKMFADRARKSIDVLPETEYRSCLEEILTFVIDRNI